MNFSKQGRRALENLEFGWGIPWLTNRGSYETGGIDPKSVWYGLRHETEDIDENKVNIRVF